MSADGKVALVHDWLTGMRGGEKVLEEMAALFPEATIHTLFHFPGTVSEALESHPIRTSFVQRLPFLNRSYRNYLPLFPRAIESFDLSGYDLVLSTSHCVAKGARTPEGTIHLCYCHTPMRYVWDQQRVYFPESRSPVAQVRDALLARLRRWDRRTAHRPTRYLANSTFVADRVRRYYGREATVVPPPVDVELFSPAEEEPRRTHLLCVAALNAYKRVADAVEAARRLDLPLVVVGTGPDEGSLRRLGGDAAEFVGRVDARELRRLYREAIAFVQPGIEDFGIAAVESLACGTPVVAAGEGGVLDIVEDGRDGILFAAEKGVDGLVRALRQLDGLTFDRQAAARRARRFSREVFLAELRRQIDAAQSSR